MELQHIRGGIETIRVQQVVHVLAIVSKKKFRAFNNVSMDAPARWNRTLTGCLGHGVPVATRWRCMTATTCVISVRRRVLVVMIRHFDQLKRKKKEPARPSLSFVVLHCTPVRPSLSFSVPLLVLRRLKITLTENFPSKTLSLPHLD